MSSPSNYAKSYLKSMFIAFIISKLFSALYTPKRTGFIWQMLQKLRQNFVTKANSNKLHYNDLSTNKNEPFIDVDRTFK